MTEGIYAILNARSVAERGGELRVTDLTDVLDFRRYPPERHLFILDLMRKFGLCFTYPDGETWLVPELLDMIKTRAAELTEFVYQREKQGRSARIVRLTEETERDTAAALCTLATQLEADVNDH